MSVMTIAKPLKTAPATKYGGKIVVCQPGSTLVAKSNETTLRDRTAKKIREAGTAIMENGPPTTVMQIRAAVYGGLALGWRGSHRHWQNYERAYLILAALSTPLVLSVHSIVSWRQYGADDRPSVSVSMPKRARLSSFRMGTYSTRVLNGAR